MCSDPVTDSQTAGIVLQINWLLQQHFSKYIRDIRQPRAGVKCAGPLPPTHQIGLPGTGLSLQNYRENQNSVSSYSGLGFDDD